MDLEGIVAQVVGSRDGGDTATAWTWLVTGECLFPAEFALSMERLKLLAIGVSSLWMVAAVLQLRSMLQLPMTPATD
jgi:hypothetical protein